jgi:hypothetical protein
MIGELPFISAPQSVTVQLGSAKYRFKTQFNSRSGVWTFDLYDAADRMMIASVALVLGQDLLEPYNFGIGRIVCIDTSKQGVEAGPNDLGVRVKVYWVSEDEVLP